MRPDQSDLIVQLQHWRYPGGLAASGGAGATEQFPLDDGARNELQRPHFLLIDLGQTQLADELFVQV